MLKTGKEHLECLRDGRVVYIGGEQVDDVTVHPAFRNAARSMAGVYDMKADPANRDLMSFEENGGRYSMYFLMARDRADLERRMKAHKAIADFSHGLYGRSMDHVASFVTAAEASRAPWHGPWGNFPTGICRRPCRPMELAS